MSDSEWWYIDLAAIIALAGTAVLGLILGVSGVLRIFLALPLVLFLSGYSLVAILFPDAKPAADDGSFDEQKTGLQNPLVIARGIGSIERFVLSVVMSIAILPAVALASTVTPWGISARPVFTGIGLVTILLALLAIVSRARCPAEKRFSPSIPDHLLFTNQGRSAYDKTHVRVYNVALVCSLVILLVTAGYALANPPEEEGFTEFYVETEEVTNQTGVMYEETYTQGEPQDLTVYVENQEGTDVTYETVALLQRVEYPTNSSVDGTATVLESTELTRSSLTVPGGETGSQDLEIAPTMTGEGLQITVLLYEGQAPAEPSQADAYRVITLPIEVV